MAKFLFVCFLLPLLLNAEDVAPVLSLAKMPEPLLGPDAMVKERVPQGKVTERIWKNSKVYPGTIRTYSVYQSAQYEAKKPAAVMVFQDGHSYLNPKGDCRATVVLDNLIASKEIPPIIGIFINPGHLAEELPKEPWPPPFSRPSVRPDCCFRSHPRKQIPCSNSCSSPYPNQAPGLP